MADDNNNRNGTKVHIPLAIVLAAVGGLACYSAKINNDLVQVQRDTVRILERIDMRQTVEASRNHSEHRAISESLLRLSAPRNWNRTIR